MVTFVYFTEEQKRQAKMWTWRHTCSDGEKNCSHPDGKNAWRRSEYTIRGNEWFDHETQTGGIRLIFSASTTRCLPGSRTGTAGRTSGTDASGSEKERYAA